VQARINAGANVNLRDKSGLTALLYGYKNHKIIVYICKFILLSI
jgi:hypothetical protein